MNNSINWQKIKLIIKVVEVRLRFIAILLITALVIGYWDTITNYWDKWTRTTAVEVGQLAPDQEFYCPMHPQVVRNSLDPNGETPHCPICGMPLSLRKKGGQPALEPGVTGRVQLSPERVQLAGIETVEIGYQPLLKQTITSGNVVYDQSRLSRIVSRVNGYVEKIYVDTTFVPVKQGDPLAEIYSPQLFTSSQELLIIASQKDAKNDLLDPARQRLELLGMSDQEIDAILASGKAVPRAVIRSPKTGYVIGKDIMAGSRVEEGMTLLDIADLSTVWIEADVYEKDIAYIRPEQTIQATVEAIPNRVFQGEVALIYTQLDPATRTVRVRFKVNNDSGELRPGMFATVRIDTPLNEVEQYKAAEVLTVPERSVIDTGTRKIVYIERKPGLFEGVEVELGPRVGGFYPVLKGLDPGQKVAAAGAFLIDAETRLNPSAGTYFGAGGGPVAGKTHDTMTMPQSSHATAIDDGVSERIKKNLAQLSPDDQKIAAKQKFCPITGQLLGSMGIPVKIRLKDRTVFLCCGACIDEAKKDPDKTLKKIDERK